MELKRKIFIGKFRGWSYTQRCLLRSSLTIMITDPFVTSKYVYSHEDIVVLTGKAAIPFLEKFTASSLVLNSFSRASLCVFNSRNASRLSVNT